MKKFIKIGAALLALLVVVIAAAVLVLRTQFPPERIGALASQQLTDILKRETTVGRASLSAWPLGVRIEDLRVANGPGAGFSPDPFIHLPELLVRIDLGKLFIFQVVVQEVRLTGLQVLLETLPDGRSSLDGLGGEPTSEKDPAAPLDLSNIELPGSFLLQKFTLVDAKVRMLDRKSGREVVLEDIDHRVDLSLDRTLESIITTGELLLQGISVSDKATGVRKGGVRISVTHDLSLNLRAQQLQLRKLELGIQDIRVNVQGTASDFLGAVPQLDMTVASNEISLASLLREVPASINPEIAKIKAEGKADFNLTIKGPVGGTELPQVVGALNLAALGLSHSDLPAGITHLDGKISFTQERVQISPFGFRLGGQPVDLLLLLDGLPAAPHLRQLQLNANLDLGALMALLAKVAPVPAGFELKGLLAAQLRAQGPLDPARPERLQVDGSATLQNGFVRTAELPDPLQIESQTKFGNTRITQSAQVRIGPSDVAVQAEITDFLAFLMPEKAPGRTLRLGVQVRSSNLELDRLMPPPSPQEVENPQAIPMEQFPEIPDIIANIDVQLGRTVFRHLAFSDFRVKTDLLKKVLNVDLTGRIYGGSIASKVKADLTNRKSADVAVFLDLTKVEANDFISNGNDNIEGQSPLAVKIRDLDNTLYGKLDMRLDVKTQGLPQTFVDNLVGRIAVSSYEGRIVGSKIGGELSRTVGGFEVAGRKVLAGIIPDISDIRFKELKAELYANKGQIEVRDFSLKDTPLGALALQGSVGTDATLNLTVINTTTPAITRKLDEVVAGAQRAVTGAAQSALGSAGAALAAGVMGTALYPKDAQGNAQFFLNLTGTFADPKAGLDSQRMLAGAKSSSPASSPVADLKADLNRKVGDAKAKAEAEARAKLDEAKRLADEQKRALQDKANAKKAEVKAKAKTEQKKVENKAKQEAGKALKKFGF